MKVFSTFTGIGGFELGIQDAYRSTDRRIETDSTRNERQGLLAPTRQSFSSSQRPVGEHDNDIFDERPLFVGYSEIDRYACSVYERHFPGVQNYGDITTIAARELPDFDLLVGGFPCQAFSIAGKRRGFEDTRGTLFFDLARILQAKQPRYFIFENVKGLLSHDGGQTFKTIIVALTELGYDCQWQVLNSKDFGVPQNRERVFIVGYFRGQSRPKVFPIERTNNQAIKEITEGVRETKRVYGADGLSPTLNTMQGGQRQPKVVIPVLTPQREEKRQNGRRFKTDGEPAFTLNTQDQHGVLISKTVRVGGLKSPHGSKQNWDSYEVNGQVRRLTPLECERLQGFPDVEKSSIINLCLDPQNSYVFVEMKNLKSPKLAGIAEKEDQNEIASSVKKNLNTNDLQISKLVQEPVLINCEEGKVEILNPGKLPSYVNIAEILKKLAPQVDTDLFAQLLVSINTTVEKIIHYGKEESHQNEPCLTPAPTGSKLENVSGEEIMRLVKDATFDSSTKQNLLKCITSSPSDLKSLEQKLATLFSYVILATTGYIQKGTQNNNTLQFQIVTKHGWTKYGKDGEPISDTQRYKMCGNAVTTNVVGAIYNRMLDYPHRKEVS